MQGITINELYNALAKEIKKGNGDYKIFITDDEEANGYHALWYLGKTPKEMEEGDRQFIEDSNCDLCILVDKDKAYYMG